jgi:uracil-DNA glycosylase
VVVTLGRIAFDAFLKLCEETGIVLPRPRPRFVHGAQFRLGRGLTVLASYHPSQQNTLTRRLTRPMFHAVFRDARRLLSKGKNLA